MHIKSKYIETSKIFNFPCLDRAQPVSPGQHVARGDILYDGISHSPFPVKAEID
jgi:hypothetical protein